MVKNLLLSFCLTFLGLSINAQNYLLNEADYIQNLDRQEDPRSFLLSRSHLDLNALLDHVFDSLTNASTISGFNAAILFDDGSVWKRANGQAVGFPFPQPMTEDHLMAMGSISKTFVATTIMLLVEDGLLNLDDPLHLYLPDYPNIDNRISIRQLLSHTSGLNDFLNENPNTTTTWATYLDSIWHIDTVLNHFVLEPNFSAGTGWSYSNTNFLLAGRIIEVVTGRAWYEVVRDRIIDPLNLTSTFTYPWEDFGTLELAHAFVDIDGNGSLEDAQGYGFNLDGLFSLASSAGCLISTPENIARFNKMLFTGQIVNSNSLMEMTTNYIPGPPSNGLYGLGTTSFPLGEPNWGHNGSLIYQSLALYFPNYDISLAIQQNDPTIGNNQNPQIDIYFIFQELVNAIASYVPTSLQELENNVTMDIFPNPVSNHLNITIVDHSNLQKDTELKIYAADGKLIDIITLTGKNISADVSDLQDGWYIIRLGNNVGKFLKAANR